MFYAAKLRAVCHKQLFPPKAKGGDNPFIFLNAISHVFSEGLKLEIMNELERYKKVIARIATLDPVPEIGSRVGTTNLIKMLKKVSIYAFFVKKTI